MKMTVKNLDVKCRDCRHCGKIRKNDNGVNLNDCNYPHVILTDLHSDVLFPCHLFQHVPNCILLWKRKLKDE